MNDEVAKALIVTIGGGLLSLLGIWIGKRPQPDRRKSPTEEERRNDTALMDFVKHLVEQQVAGLKESVRNLETQRDEREKRIDELEDENRDLRGRVERQDVEIADLKTRLQLMQDREMKRNG